MLKEVNHKPMRLAYLETSDGRCSFIINHRMNIAHLDYIPPLFIGHPRLL